MGLADCAPVSVPNLDASDRAANTPFYEHELVEKRTKETALVDVGSF